MDMVTIVLAFMWISMCSGNEELHASEYHPRDSHIENLSGTRNSEQDFPTDGPKFLTKQSTNVTVLAGQNARLSCRVKDLGNWTVSWIRHRDTHLISVGHFLYAADLRFRPSYKHHYTDPATFEENVTSYAEWGLDIMSLQKRDDGVYECQINTTPFRSMFVYLRVIDPITMILGSPEVYVDKGSTINLTCVILQAPEPPNSIRWTQNNKAITYDSPRGGVSVIVEKGIQSSSSLIIQNARLGDSGNYTCRPDNAGAATVMLNVLKELPAAMQHGGSLKQSSNLMIVTICLLLYLVVQLQPKSRVH